MWLGLRQAGLSLCLPLLIGFEMIGGVAISLQEGVGGLWGLPLHCQGSDLQRNLALNQGGGSAFAFRFWFSTWIEKRLCAVWVKGVSIADGLRGSEGGGYIW